MESINTFISVVAISLLVIVVQCASVSKLPPAILVQQHQARVAMFQCGDPQPRLVHHSKFINVTGKVEPACTVLHRCDESTCSCGVNAACLPEEVEPVTLHFRERLLKGKRYHEVKTVNHTRCSCQENTPK